MRLDAVKQDESHRRHLVVTVPSAPTWPYVSTPNSSGFHRRADLAAEVSSVTPSLAKSRLSLWPWRCAAHGGHDKRDAHRVREPGHDGGQAVRQVLASPPAASGEGVWNAGFYLCPRNRPASPRPRAARVRRSGGRGKRSDAKRHCGSAYSRPAFNSSVSSSLSPVEHLFTPVDPQSAKARIPLRATPSAFGFALLFPSDGRGCVERSLGPIPPALLAAITVPQFDVPYRPAFLVKTSA